MSIQHEHSLLPITALGFYEDRTGNLLVLAGEGPLLKIFEAVTSKLRCQCVVFTGQTVHGIAVNPNAAGEDDLNIVIWGGSSLSLLRKATVDQILNASADSVVDLSISVSDWILDAAISTSQDGSCVVVTAHNTVIRANLESSGNILLTELHSPSRSILYSAHLIWDTQERVLVAAGTVFGEIIVWECPVSNDSSKAHAKGQILFTFTGHEGSIFGVNISPPLLRPDRTIGRLLASCSDDRTIRIWDLATGFSFTDESTTSVSPRDTGFGSGGETIQNQCLAMAMGHVSRIWRVKFIVSGSKSEEIPNINILSFGEDSTTQQWSLDFGHEYHTNRIGEATNISELPTQVDSHITASLTNVKIFALHSGKHIWSAATRLIDGCNGNQLITGGADGKISFLDINLPENDQCPTAPAHASATVQNENFVWDLEDLLATFPPKSSANESYLPIPIHTDLPNQSSEDKEGLEVPKTKKKKPKKVQRDAFNRYAFISENDVLVTTLFGRVLLGNIGKTLVWEEVSLPESVAQDLTSYAVVRGFPEIGHVYLAGASGKIYDYRRESGILEVGNVNGKVADMIKVINFTTGNHSILVTRLMESSATLLSINENSTQEFQTPLTYTLPKKFIVTAAGRIGRLLALGSRTGSIALYNIDTREQLTCLWTSENHLLGDAITTISPFTTSESDQGDETFHFLTTSRKGIYSILRFTFTRGFEDQLGTVTITPAHNGTPRFGPMIEDGWFSENELNLYGFKGKNFVVWNETRQSEIMNVECGGAHRSYAYSPAGAGGHFIYTKASKLYLHTQLSLSHKIIKRGGHGREMKACTISPSGNLIATGAEDTSIRIWSYTAPGDFGCLAIVQQHTAGIQHLQWHGENYLFSSGGNEEFFIWAISEIPGLGIGVVCEATCPDPTEERDLRIMSFDVSRLPSEDSGKQDLLISLAYSDSTIRVYRYSKASGFELLATDRYTSSCLMQIRHIQVSDKEFYLLTTATDGNVAIWHTNNQVSPTPPTLSKLFAHKLHQNSIKSLDTIVPNPGKYTVVVTGGDDSALGISLYNNSTLSLPPKSFILRSAHAAAITGLCIIPMDNENSFKIVTSSNDQRVKTWDVRIEQDGSVGLKKAGDSFTAIADVGDVVSLRMNEGERRVMVVGNGTEVWRVEK